MRKHVLARLPDELDSLSPALTDAELRAILPLRAQSGDWWILASHCPQWLYDDIEQAHYRDRSLRPSGAFGIYWCASHAGSLHVCFARHELMDAEELQRLFTRRFARRAEDLMRAIVQIGVAGEPGRNRWTSDVLTCLASIGSDHDLDVRPAILVTRQDAMRMSR